MYLVVTLTHETILAFTAQCSHPSLCFSATGVESSFVALSIHLQICKYYKLIAPRFAMLPAFSASFPMPMFSYIFSMKIFDLLLGWE